MVDAPELCLGQIEGRQSGAILARLDKSPPFLRSTADGAEVCRHYVAFADPFFLFRSDTGPALRSHGRLLEQCLRKLRGAAVEPRSAVDAQIDVRLAAG